MRLRALTLNCWGLPVVARHRQARMTAIGKAVADMGLDVAAFQEIYLESDRQRVLGETSAAGLTHSHYFPSGTFGSGLLVLSRFPITETTFLRFRLNGRPQDVIRGDYYAGKGLGRARLSTPTGLLDVYNAHLIAAYTEIGADSYFFHRVAQAWEIARAIDALSADVPALLACDLNAIPDSLPYRTCTVLGGLQDSYRTVHPAEPGVTVTTDIPYLLVHAPERIDYILSRSGGARSLQALSSEVVLRHVAPEFEDKILAYSDHYGVHSTFELVPAGPAAPVDRADALEQVQAALQAGLEQVRERQAVSAIGGGAAAGTAALLLALRSRVSVSRRRFIRLLGAGTTAGLVTTAGFGLSSTLELRAEAEVVRSLLAELDSPLGSPDEAG